MGFQHGGWRYRAIEARVRWAWLFAREEDWLRRWGSSCRIASDLSWAVTAVRWGEERHKGTVSRGGRSVSLVIALPIEAMDTAAFGKGAAFPEKVW